MSKKRVELEVAATQAVQRSGFSHLSFRTLAESVGVKSSSVHYYFPEKADLATAVIESYSGDFAAQLALIDAQFTNARSKLDAFVKIFEDAAAAEKFCLCGMMAAEVDQLAPVHRTALADYFKHMEDWIVSVLSQDKPALRSNLAPQTLARLVISGLEGALLVDRVDGSRSRLQAQREFIKDLLGP